MKTLSEIAALGWMRASDFAGLIVALAICAAFLAYANPPNPPKNQVLQTIVRG